MSWPTRTERANAAVAAAQDRLYWLDRWHVDANRVLGSRAGRWAFEAGRLGPPAAREHPPPDAMSERVTAVVPVKDGARYLGELLDALAREGVDEVLVVDSGSRDGSVDLARRAGATVIEIAPGAVRPRPHAQPRRPSARAAT